MQQTSYENISVTELCAQAGLNRTTFYKYYKDISALAAEWEREQLSRFGALLRENELTGEPLLRLILDSVERSKQLFGTDKGGVLADRFRSALIATARQYGLQAWKRRLPDTDPREAELAYEGLLAGAIHIALSENAEKDRDKVVRTITAMINAYIEAAGRSARPAVRQRITERTGYSGAAPKHIV